MDDEAIFLIRRDPGPQKFVDPVRLR